MDVTGTAARGDTARGVVSKRASKLAFFSVVTLIFVCAAALTVVRCVRMAAMGGMPMPGGWTLSMTWLRMPGQTWLGAAAAFAGQWLVMMVAMMLPSLTPMLSRYRQAISNISAARSGFLSVLVGLGYFSVWTVFGMLVFPLGVAAEAIAMHQPLPARTVPVAAGVVVLLAGAFQFTAWKTHQLACSRQTRWCDRALPADAGAAWRHGLHLGLQCSYCCANLMAILCIIGVMELRVMAGVTAVVTAERLAPAGERIARAIGIVVIAAGVFLILRVIGFG